MRRGVRGAPSARHRILPLIAVAVWLLPGAPRAADHPMRGRLLDLRDPPADGGREIHFRSGRDAGGLAGDPRVGGAVLEVTGTGTGDGTSGRIALPAGRWRALRRGGFRYRDRSVAGGVREVRVARGGRRPTLEVDGGGAAWSYSIAQRQNAVDVRFTLGDEVYCARFTRFVHNRPGRLLARAASAPPDCGGRVVTPVCGNLAVET